MKPSPAEAACLTHRLDPRRKILEHDLDLFEELGAGSDARGDVGIALGLALGGEDLERLYRPGSVGVWRRG
jgi:hypothetical protein